MNEPNDPKLCLAMAKLLPDLLTVIRVTEYDLEPRAFWRHGTVCYEKRKENEVLDTEWLYVMQLVEDTLKDGPDAGAEKYQYAHALYRVIPKGRQPCCATFNQRARAMCEVKGITP